MYSLLSEIVGVVTLFKVSGKLNKSWIKAKNYVRTCVDVCKLHSLYQLQRVHVFG